MPKTRTIKVLVLGDSGVGKTAFINTLFSEVSYPTENMLQPVLLPPNLCLSCPDVYTELIDTHNSRTNLAQAVNNADIILLMYDLSNPETVERLGRYWMRVISGINSTIPVVVCGNKLDKLELQIRNVIDYTPIRDVVKPIAREFAQVQMGLECSAYYNKNVSAVLNHLQVAVLFPLTPLYNFKERCLTERFKRILTRIFRVLDEDTDGQLSDSELSKLEERVFSSELNTDDIRKIKEIIRVELECYDMNNIKLEGFIAMNLRCVQMKNMQICWGILHNFGYNQQLELVPSADRLIVKENTGMSIELKDRPRDFLIRLFQFMKERYQHEETNAKLLDQLFYPNDGIPLPELMERRQSNYPLSIEEFIVAWSCFTNQNYKQCFEALNAIGYEGSLEDTFHVTSSKISFKDMQRIQQRAVIYVGLLDSGGDESNYIKSFFVHHTIEEGVERSYFLHSTADSSKLFVLYRLTPDNMIAFMRNVNPYYGKLLDVVVEFEEQWRSPQQNQVLRYIPDSIMRRRISQAEFNSMQIRDRPAVLEMNLLESSGRKHLLSELMTKVWELVQHPETGYSPEKLVQLQRLNKKDWNLPLIGTVLAVGGYLAYRIVLKLKS